MNAYKSPLAVLSRTSMNSGRDGRTLLTSGHCGVRIFTSTHGTAQFCTQKLAPYAAKEKKPLQWVSDLPCKLKPLAPDNVRHPVALSPQQSTASSSHEGLTARTTKCCRTSRLRSLKQSEIDKISQIGNFMTKILQSFDGSCCLGFSNFFRGRVILLHIQVNRPQANSSPLPHPPWCQDCTCRYCTQLNSF